MSYFVRVFNAVNTEIATVYAVSIDSAMRKAKKMKGCVHYKIWNEVCGEFNDNIYDYISYSYNYITKKFKRN